MKITRNVASMQAKNCLLCIHIGENCATFFHVKGWSALKLELFTEFHTFDLRFPRRLGKFTGSVK